MMGPRVFLTAVTYNYDSAIQFYCDVLGLFDIDVDTRLSAGAPTVILKYNVASVPLSLVLHSHNGPSYLADQGEKRLFQVGIYHPDIRSVRSRLVEGGFEVADRVVPLGSDIVTRDPYGNVVVLSNRLFDDE